MMLLQNLFSFTALTSKLFKNSNQKHFEHPLQTQTEINPHFLTNYQITTMLTSLLTISLSIYTISADLGLNCDYVTNIKWGGDATIEGTFPLNKCSPTYYPWDNSYSSEIFRCNSQKTNIIIDFYNGPSCSGSIQYSYSADSVEDFNCPGIECDLYSFQSETRVTSSNTTCPSESNNNNDLTTITYSIPNVCHPVNATFIIGVEDASMKESCDQSSNSYSQLLYANNDCSGDAVLNFGDSAGNCVNFAVYGFAGICECIEWVNCDGGDSNPNQLPTPPTTEPTPTPSSGTTAEPTTGVPTEDPTTMEPTSPTTEPTVDPTNDPTEDTMSPSMDPTMEPTDIPTKDPTQVTSMPSKSPTSDPTLSPVGDGDVDTSNGVINGGLFGCLVIVMIFVVGLIM